MLGFRLGLFAGMFQIAGAFSGLFAYGIFKINSSRFKDWQLLFLIEVGATLFMAIVSFIVLPRRLDTAWFLTPEQRAHAERRIQIDCPTVDRDGNPVGDDHKVTKQNVLDAFSDWRILLVICCNIASVLPVSVFSVFMPLIVRGMGYEALEANLMSVTPFVAAVRQQKSITANFLATKLSGVKKHAVMFSRVPQLFTLALYLGNTVAKGPFLTQTNTSSWIFGNDHWNLTQGPNYATKLFSTIVPGKDLVGTAKGHYLDSSSPALFTSASIVSQDDNYVDISFASAKFDLHWVIFDDLQGAYQYVVNKNSPWTSIIRNVWRFDPDLFLNARTHIKDDVLPPFALYDDATEVQDETFQLPNGTTITKYDWSNFERERDFYGVYGPGVVGSWWIHPSTEYFPGNQLSQTLTVHRESNTGDAVQLNVFQDTSHFRVGNDTLPPVGKIWGPWLWYLNNGSKEDVSNRRLQELRTFPYPWLNNTAYHSRGEITGTLTLSDGRPAAKASIFLGDTNTSIRPLIQGTNYYYTTQAATDGSFSLSNVRTGDYSLYAWSDGGSLADVYTNFTLTPIKVTPGNTLALGKLTWDLPQNLTPIFRLGSFDKKASEFANGGLPYAFNITSLSPANLNYTIGSSTPSKDWYYASSALGIWNIVFNISASDLRNHTSAVLSISLAGYSQNTIMEISVNGFELGTAGKDILGSDPALYRSGRISGEWRFLQYVIDASELVEGRNSVGFRVTRETKLRGFMWDCVLLEWRD
ncbi:Rhamnogalacturonate lyase [Venturia nashicola]|uniref:Rhamnogalacturonate lyase n=1 Tax=Venturia nashicola TaxID=86259 RepID=A0A4Z1PEQ3_9PEZI|nr:Rhamnogalacturonate lyase [Venturia nashicola]